MMTWILYLPQMNKPLPRNVEERCKGALAHIAKVTLIDSAFVLSLHVYNLTGHV